MIAIKTLSIKNFMSVGAVSQSINFDNSGLTLVLGENLDLGGSGSRNGCGKTSLVNAISYGLYGQAISNIKRDNLINTINKKNMVVSIEFERDGTTYRIERGRKPTFFKYFVDNQAVDQKGSDEAQGESKETQVAIDNVLGLSYSMFRHIVCLNTYTEPFLSMGAGKQREIIEELLGITLLSQKADNLKELIKATKGQIENEEFRVHTVKNSNQRILTAISDLENKNRTWDQQTATQIIELEQAIQQLSNLDIDAEISAHRQNSTAGELERSKAFVKRELVTKTQHFNQLKTQQSQLIQQYASVQSHNCPMCGQHMHDNKQTQLIEDLEAKIASLDTSISKIESELSPLGQELQQAEAELAQNPRLTTVYDTIDAAFEHRNSVSQLNTELQKLMVATNPYAAQLTSLNSTLQDVDYDELNSLTMFKDHQEFLLRLLTNKDSFIRKKIIDQNLAYLNHRLNEYLVTLGITHQVRFQNDLTVEINYMGQDMDFAQLSRGESTRVILSLSWAFRDIWENMNTTINFLGIDELLDSGLDSVGLEKAIEILKGMSRDRRRNVFLISHREELISRVNSVLTVVKENGFTSLNWNYEPEI